MNQSTTKFVGLSAICLSATLGAGCSAGSGAGTGSAASYGEKTGTIVAELTSVPPDVLCVEIQTYYYGSSVLTDVKPGAKATIVLPQINPGYAYISGTAYNVPCSQVSPYYPYSADGGASNVTWEADEISVYVYAGGTTNADLHFHQLGKVDVGVSFDNAGYCTGADASFAYCPGATGGEGGSGGGFTD